MSGIDAFTQQALEMITSPKARDAFDLSQEPAATRERYGKYCENFLLARRLVEAGVSVVTLKVGDWDTHEKNFIDMREQLPQLDQGFHALVTDLHERGLEKDVAVVLWGEFGRAPRISRGDGRDHWPEAGAAVLAGGGFQVGQVIGETDAHGGRSQGHALHAGQRPGQPLSPPGHRPGDHDPRPQPAADARARRSRAGARADLTRSFSCHSLPAAGKQCRQRATCMETNIDIFQDDQGQFCLTVMDAYERTYALFEELELQGGGYTWEGIVTALVEMNMPEALPSLQIGAEADNMHVYCRDRSCAGADREPRPGGVR